MLIFDGHKRRIDDDVFLLLTSSEALNLLASVESVLSNGEGIHEHTSSEDEQTTLTVAVYVPGQVRGFVEANPEFVAAVREAK